MNHCHLTDVVTRMATQHQETQYALQQLCGLLNQRAAEDDTDYAHEGYEDVSSTCTVLATPLS